MAQPSSFSTIGVLSEFDGPLMLPPCAANHDYAENLSNFYSKLGITPEQEIELQELNTVIVNDPHEIKMDANGTLIAATLPQLLLILTSNSNNMDFQKKFLTTFPSFTTSNYVLAALLTRFFPDLCDPEKHYNISPSDVKTLRDRIVRIITTWTKTAPYQFNETIISVLELFKDKLEEMGHSGEGKSFPLLATILNASITKVTGRSVDQSITIAKQKIPDIMPLPEKPEIEWEITDINPIELARQITLLHCEIFMKIGPMELLTAIWGEKKEGGAPNVDELTRQFDIFSRYVSYSILKLKTPHDRAHLYKYWVDVATEFLEHQNLHGMFSVMSGITHVSIDRMSETIKATKRTNANRKKNFARLIEITDFGQNYANYREFLKIPHHPRILFLGAFQKDLIYVQEKFPNKIDGLISVQKCDECMKLLDTIAGSQLEKFMFHPVPRIQELIRNLPESPQPTELMKISISLEKKKK